MPLNFYRRHCQECEAGLAEESRSGEFEERKKGWQRYACFIFASGTLGGKFKRKCTGKSDWEGAKTLASAWEQSGSRDDSPGAPPATEAPKVQSDRARVKIADGIKVFLSNRERGKYRTFTSQTADARGYVMLDQITSGDIDLFYGAWELGARAKGKRLGTLRAFFRFCVNRKWLQETPVSSDIKPPLGANRVANQAPFTDDELKRIFDGCDALGAVEWTNGRESGAWTTETSIFLRT